MAPNEPRKFIKNLDVQLKMSILVACVGCMAPLQLRGNPEFQSKLQVSSFASAPPVALPERVGRREGRIQTRTAMVCFATPLTGYERLWHRTLASGTTRHKHGAGISVWEQGEP